MQHSASTGSALLTFVVFSFRRTLQRSSLTASRIDGRHEDIRPLVDFMVAPFSFSFVLAREGRKMTVACSR